jgi:hypothetical protein
MKYLAWALILIGLVAILLGFESCHYERAAYFASHPDFASTDGDMNESDAEEVFIFVAGGGTIIFCTGLYLRSRGKMKK